MKTVFILDTHSFIDVITNSSTELFVCNTDKTVDAVREIFNQLIHDYCGEENTYRGYYGVGDVYVYTQEMFDERMKEALEDSKRYYTEAKEGIKTGKTKYGKPLDQWDIKDYNKIIATFEANPIEEVIKDYGWSYELDPNNIGKILVFSKEDNSIPYEIWDTIENIFDANRYHLG